MMCKPPICADRGLSLPTIMELIANQLRKPVGNGTSFADFASPAHNTTNTPAYPSVRQTFRIIVPPKVVLQPCTRARYHCHYGAVQFEFPMLRIHHKPR